MAVVTDVLQTLMVVKGADTAIAAFSQTGQTLQGVAARQTLATRGAALFSTALQSLGGVAGIVTIGLGALAAATTKALQTFAEDEQAIFRTTVVLRNLGNSFPIERAQAFASEIQKTVAIDDEAIVSLIGLEKRFGIADEQIEATTRTIVDFSKATGIGLEEAGQTVGKALLGQTRGLKALGIEFKATGNKARDLATIQAKLNALFGGAGAAQRNTLAGSVTALNEALANLFSAIGQKLAPLIIPFIDKMTSAIDKLTSNLDLFLGVIGNFVGGPLGGLIGQALGRSAGQPNAAEKIGTGKGGLATEGTLKEIAENTEKQSELIRRVLGGPGTAARGALNARDFRLAFGA